MHTLVTGRQSTPKPPGLPSPNATNAHEVPSHLQATPARHLCPLKETGRLPHTRSPTSLIGSATEALGTEARMVMKSLYTPTPNAFFGKEGAGQTSAW